MVKYGKIFKIYCPYEEDVNYVGREEYDNSLVDDVFEKLMDEIPVNDFIDHNVCFLRSSIYIRDDGRKAKRIFNLLNQYSHMVMEEVSHDIIMENSYLEDNDLLDKDEEWKSYNEYPIEMFRKYRIDVTSTDDVLDKIIEKGIDYLDDIDKDILENKKPS